METLAPYRKHWKFVADQKTSSYLIEGWQVLWSSNSPPWHRNVKRVHLLTHSQSWTVERTKNRNPWEFRGPLRAQGVGSSKPRINSSTSFSGDNYDETCAQQMRRARHEKTSDSRARTSENQLGSLWVSPGACENTLALCH